MLQEANPREKVAAIFDRYQRILCGKTEGEREERSDQKKAVSNLYPQGKVSQQKGGARWQRNNGAVQSLKVSIRTRVRSGGANGPETIQVDTTAYRRSRRLSRNRTRSSSRTAVEDPPESASKPSESDSSSFLTPPPFPSRSPSFQSELWTDIYRPVTSSEVIGNRTHVERLLAWLRAWGAKYSNLSPESNGQTQECSAPTRTGSVSLSTKNSAPEKTERAPPTPVPWWAKDVDDSDFVSIAHLRRKRVVSRFPNSSDTDEGGSEEGEEESPCPVMLLCGDHGSGKTAAVYACAKELGYKVGGATGSLVMLR